MQRILIVDDSAVIRESVRALLQQHPGWEVCGEAVNGIDGLLKARELRPDLVVLDLSMPMMNGLEAARQLKLFMPLIRIVLFTSHDGAQVQREARAAGIPEVVSKESAVGSLTTAIEKLLQLQPQNSPDA